jgi:DnaJ-domain-containing protein 1
MELDHHTGTLDGTVLEGMFRGARLSELSLEQLITLWRDLRVHDEDSARLLEAFMDRQHDAAWRKQAGAEPADPAPPQSSQMTRDEAYQILGLEPDTPDVDIIAAHRRLMQKLHPDRGGSTYLAAKINQAKDCLLGH